jgi:hypothetical protein
MDLYKNWKRYMGWQSYIIIEGKTLPVDSGHLNKTIKKDNL